MEMTVEEKQAYEWALKQDFNSVAARYARSLANYIQRIGAVEQSVQRTAGTPCPECGKLGGSHLWSCKTGESRR